MREQKGITLIALIITIIVMLILAGVSISLTVGEDGVINKANQAVEQTSMAQIKERAELVKASVELEKKLKDFDYMHVTKEFREDLAKELGGRVEGNTVVTKDEEYAVTLESINSDIIVSKYFGRIDPSLYIVPNYEITGNAVKISLSIDEVEIQKIYDTATSAEKEYYAVQYTIYTNDGKFKHLSDPSILTYDELAVKYLNTAFGYSHDTIEEYLNDQSVEDYAKANNLISANEKLTKAHLYYYVFGKTSIKIEGVETGYFDYCIAKKLGNLKLKIEKNGSTIYEEAFNINTGVTLEDMTEGIYDISIIGSHNGIDMTFVSDQWVINKIEE